MILSLASSSAYSISLIVLHLSLTCLSRDAKMWTTCQSLHERDKGDSVPERYKESDAGALYFFDIGVGLQ